MTLINDNGRKIVLPSGEYKQGSNTFLVSCNKIVLIDGFGNRTTIMHNGEIVDSAMKSVYAIMLRGLERQ